MDNKVTAQMLIAIWNEHTIPDLPTLKKVIDSNYVCHDPNTVKDFGKGPDGFKARVKFFTAAFPDLHIAVEETMDGKSEEPCKICGSTYRVIQRWMVTATHKGELFGFPPTNKPIHCEGVSIGHYSDDGKLLEDYVAWDSANLLAQIGGEEHQAAAS